MILPTTAYVHKLQLGVLAVGSVTRSATGLPSVQVPNRKYMQPRSEVPARVNGVPRAYTTTRGLGDTNTPGHSTSLEYIFLFFLAFPGQSRDAPL